MSDLPDLWWSGGHWSNEAFPLRTWLSLGWSEEEIVFCADFHCSENGLLFTCDVCLADGQVVADMPSARLSDHQRLAPWVRSQVDSAMDFFDLQVELVIDLLHQSRPTIEPNP